MHHPILRVLAGLRMTLRAETDAHAELRSRMGSVITLTIVLDVLAGGVAYACEHGHGDTHSYWDALFWTTTQMLTVSSSLNTPVTTAGKILDVFLELYAVVVVTSAAGVFASFFHHRYHERKGAGGPIS